MSAIKSITTELVLATRPVDLNSHGLLTVIVEVPLFVWVELLTHKRPARNASSSRAQSPKRHRGMGYYIPDTFYLQGEGMAVGDPLPYAVSQDIQTAWIEAHEHIYAIIEEFDERTKAYLTHRGIDGRIANGIVNRLLPTTKMMRGIVTATEDAWACLLALRNHPAADSGMQVMARQIQAILDTPGIWRHSNYHVPLISPPVDTEEQFKASWKESAGMTARVSYGTPGPGQRSSEDLANDLLLATPMHASPFEHSAMWVECPRSSALCSTLDDMKNKENGVYGWENCRAMIEIGCIG